VTLATADVAAERAWWSDRLGLPDADDPPVGGFAVWAGDGVLAFAPAPERAARPCHHLALEVAPDRLVEASEWLSTVSPLVVLDDGETIVDFPNWAAHSVYACTPTGHVIELIARHRRPWSPGPDDRRPADVAAGHPSWFVRGLSEVGVCAPDVGALVDRLDGLGLPLWFGDPRTGFAAAGEESGLIICAREWRPWFPTDRAAAPGPVTIELEGVPALAHGDAVPVGTATVLRAARA